MALAIYVNNSATDQDIDTTGVIWTEISPGNDKLIFTAGNTIVADGEPSPGQSELISAGIILDGTEKIIETYLLDDISANLLREIPLMGNVDAQYVLAFSFDSDTASEPVLEVWDDDNYASVDSIALGSGTPSQSFIKGVVTTTNPSGSDWTGSPLAGSSSGNFLYLNDQNGALSVAKTLYCQLKVIIPATQSSGFSLSPQFVCKWLDNE